MLRALLVFGIGGIIFGAMSAHYGYKERDIAAGSTQTPETISLKDLIARGPDGNANIVLTDYVPCDNFVIEKKHGVWEGAWVPVVPKEEAVNGEGGSPTAFKAVIFTGKARNEDALHQRLSQPQLPALVTNKIMTLDGKKKRLLQESYPQTDFSTCLIIHEGREPASEEKSAFMIYGGFAAIAIGVGLLGLALFVWRRGAAEAARVRRRSKGPLRGDEDDEDEPRPRTRAPRDYDDDEDDRSRRRPSARDQDDEDRPRRRRVDEDDEERPRRRPRRDYDD